MRPLARTREIARSALVLHPRLIVATRLALVKVELRFDYLRGSRLRRQELV